MTFDGSVLLSCHLNNIGCSLKKLILLIPNNFSLNNSSFSWLTINNLPFIKMIVSTFILLNLLLLPFKAFWSKHNVAEFIISVNKLRCVCLFLNNVSICIFISLFLNLQSYSILFNDILLNFLFNSSLKLFNCQSSRISSYFISIFILNCIILYNCCNVSLLSNINCC